MLFAGGGNRWGTHDLEMFTGGYKRKCLYEAKIKNEYRTILKRAPGGVRFCMHFNVLSEAKRKPAR